MGQSIAFAVSSRGPLTALGKFLADIARDEHMVFKESEDQLELQAKDGWWEIIIEKVEDDREFTIAGYTSNEDLDERFRREASSLSFFWIRFSNYELTRRLLRAIAQDMVAHDESGWIDTDYGWVIHISDFLKRVEADPNWDWRYSPEAQ